MFQTFLFRLTEKVAKMVEQMVNDVGYRQEPGTNEKWGPTFLNEFDEDPGSGFVDKGITWGVRGAVVGAFFGAFHAGVIEPPAKVNGLTYGLRHTAAASLVTGAFGLTLGVGIPLAQAIRNKNDPWAWAWGGFAAGSVFGLRSGRLSLALQAGSLVAAFLGVTKALDSYKKPYLEHFKPLRVAPPKHLKLLDDNGQIVSNPQQQY